ncbi:hypothetical protein BJ508DRAFT_82384 [Ascobolus immersus RN42]|uniref:Uncharacterized protein n=1 Tax=Ascobolus immersus RN42 TaxID=1160509 RepID=A0A3N4HFP4_ASCIM|nr:hypothetical protein BJ508DRAFT_82384 [Ascobolus immersus RN42]
MSDLIRLHESHPTLFPTTPASTLPASTQTAVILASAPTYHSTASQLSQIQSLGIPDPQVSTELISLLPRIEKAAKRAEEQAQKVAELRERSARVLERWVGVVVEGNEGVVGWDERVRGVGNVVGRKEAERKRREEED